MLFVKGQIIPTSMLNNIDTIIQSIKKDPTNQTYINNLISVWENLPTNSEDTNIADNIERIIEL